MVLLNQQKWIEVNLFYTLVITFVLLSFGIFFDDTKKKFCNSILKVEMVLNAPN